MLRWLWRWTPLTAPDPQVPLTGKPCVARPCCEDYQTLSVADAFESVGMVYGRSRAVAFKCHMYVLCSGDSSYIHCPDRISEPAAKPHAAQIIQPATYDPLTTCNVMECALDGAEQGVRQLRQAADAGHRVRKGTCTLLSRSIGFKGHACLVMFRRPQLDGQRPFLVVIEQGRYMVPALANALGKTRQH